MKSWWRLMTSSSQEAQRIGHFHRFLITELLWGNKKKKKKNSKKGNFWTPFLSIFSDFLLRLPMKVLRYMTYGVLLWEFCGWFLLIAPFFSSSYKNTQKKKKFKKIQNIKNLIQFIVLDKKRKCVCFTVFFFFWILLKFFLFSPLWKEYSRTLGVFGFFALHAGFGSAMRLEQFVWVWRHHDSC